MNIKDEADKFLPPWAERRSDGSYLEIKTQLCTRDGRRIGNAKVTKVGNKKAEIETDAGNKMVLSLNELIELFHRPEYILKIEVRQMTGGRYVRC